jgi:RNA polymerase sigma-70 factor (ECF subfamily)
MNTDSQTAQLQTTLTSCLARVASNRDKQAFAKLFDHFVPLIRAYSLAREPGADLVADDLAQEVMIRIWQKAHTFNSNLASLNTWVFTLARNCRIDYLRRNSRHLSDIDPETVFETIEDDSPGPFQLAHQQRLQSRIQDGFKQLPAEQVEIMRMVYLEGKSHQRTSEELSLPLGTVKSRVRLALKKLEVLLEN